MKKCYMRLAFPFITCFFCCSGRARPHRNDMDRRRDRHLSHGINRVMIDSSTISNISCATITSRRKSYFGVGAQTIKSDDNISLMKKPSSSSLKPSSWPSYPSTTSSIVGKRLCQKWRNKSSLDDMNILSSTTTTTSNSLPKLKRTNYVTSTNRRLAAYFYIYLSMLITSSMAEQSSRLVHHLQHHRQAAHAQSCTVENSICSENAATVCRNGTCVSACSLGGMKECQCDVEEDNYCYLCCGNANHQCFPAHHHNILRPNGERWEREACSRCRMHGEELEGLPCDDTDSARLCINGKCSNSVCHTKQAGSYCDRKLEKLCVDNTCENPCARFASHLMVCDCAAIDQDTGFASEDRCQLCCYDFNLKPANRRCQNAYRKYKIMDQFQKPIFRVGIECAGGKTCNKYGVCSATSINPFFIGFSLLFIYLM